MEVEGACYLFQHEHDVTSKGAKFLGQMAMSINCTFIAWYVWLPGTFTVFAVLGMPMCS